MNYLIAILLFVTPLIVTCDEIHDDKLIVTTESGLVKGYHMNSRNGREYFAFTKIPYAKPPIGKLRFKNAEPADNWEGILNADQELPSCWQVPFYDILRINLTIGTEDCLYLSVFTTKVSPDAKLPVMVYIHGGGWRSELPVTEPAIKSQYFMDQDVILVWFHYRLGALGFLSFEDSVLPGNIGMIDQAQAIKWISKNIKNFGGDPNKITLFGNSAGGSSTHLHLISPMTKHLIQNGISQSGVATALWSFSAPGVASHRAHQIAKHLNCDSESTEEIISCLLNKSAYDITDAERIFAGHNTDLTIAFTPVIDKNSDNPFLPESPYNMIVEKPWIIGLTAQDGSIKVLGYKMSSKLMKLFKKNPGKLLPEGLMYTNISENVEEITQSIIKKYHNEDNELEGLIEMWTDGLFTYGVNEALKRSNGPTYIYLFDYSGKTNFLKKTGEKIGKDFSDLGVSHTDELIYLFNHFDEESPMIENDEDQKFSERLVKIWTDFAKNNEISQDIWPQYTKGEEKYIKISNEITKESKLWPDRVEFWRNLNIRDKMEKINL